MLGDHTLCQRLLSLTIPAALCVLIVLGVSTKNSFSATLPQQAPSKPPKGYLPIIPCQSQVGQVWASPNASSPPRGNTPPMLGFYQNQLTSMIFYLSEKHLYPLLPNNGRWSFTGTINATVDSITLTPAQLRPNRDKRAYELTVAIHHDPPIDVTCSSIPPTISPGQGGESSAIPGGTMSPGQGGGSSAMPGGRMNKPKK
jgi:hypothetical protein